MSTVSLRYFTVYGPRQRPDMAPHIFIGVVLRDEPAALCGDGQQTRDFTLASDTVEATVLTADAPPEGVSDVGGGSRVNLGHAVGMLGELAGKPARIERREKQTGDVRHTWADTSRIWEATGFTPQVQLRDGLRLEEAWLQGV